MTSRTRLLIRGCLALVVLWSVIGGVIKVAGSMKPTPEKVRAYASANDLSRITDPDERKKVLSKLAEMMNEMELDDWQESDGDRQLRRKFFGHLTPEEQWYFMERRMGRAFSQMMTLFNDMARDERKTMVARALKQIRRQQDSDEGSRRVADLAEADPEMVEKVAEAGMEAYFRDASAETKIDLAPLMEEVQKVMSGTSNRRRGFRSGR